MTMNDSFPCGIWPAMRSPVDADQRIDVGCLERLVELFIAAHAAPRAGDVRRAMHFHGVFAELVEFLFSRCGALYSFIRKAMKFKYGIDVPPGRTITHRGIATVDDHDVRSWVPRVDAAANGEMTT